MAFMEKPLFVIKEVVEECILTLSEVAGIYTLDVLCYCFMPTHSHMLLKGEETSDLREFVRIYKQKTSYRYKKMFGKPLWQRGYYDRVLRKSEESFGVSAYVLQNPVRKGLVSDPRDYPYSGSFMCSIDDIYASL
jgi:putative transposase